MAKQNSEKHKAEMIERQRRRSVASDVRSVQRRPPPSPNDPGFGHTQTKEMLRRHKQISKTVEE